MLRVLRFLKTTYFNWKRKCDGLLPTEMWWLKQLGDENSKLRKVVAYQSLYKEMLQEVVFPVVVSEADDRPA